jgi:GTP-binding protein
VLAANVDKGQREIVLADIPGLIEGASQGKGLGFDFLRHLEHCQALVYVLALDDTIAAEPSIDADEKAKNLFDQLETLRIELQNHSPEFASKKTCVIVNKADLYSADAINTITQYFKTKATSVKVLSAATGDGLQDLIEMINQLVD